MLLGILLLSCILNGVDYTSLSNVDYTVSKLNINYTVSICNPVKNVNCLNKDPTTAVCMILNNFGYTLTTTYNSSLTDFSYTTYSKNLNCWAKGYNSQTVSSVYLECGDENYLVLNSMDNCFYNFTLYNSLTCVNNVDDNDNNTTLSTGWVIIIVFFVITTFYIIIGCLYNYKLKGKNGCEACPNYNFWYNFMGLVNDGFKFSYQKCIELFSKKSIIRENETYGTSETF